MANSPNVETKHKLQDIPHKSTFIDLIDSCTLSDIDKEIMRLKYLDKKSWGYIADILGYSESAVKKKHSKILSKLRKII